MSTPAPFCTEVSPPAPPPPPTPPLAIEGAIQGRSHFHPPPTVLLLLFRPKSPLTCPSHAGLAWYWYAERNNARK